jgi:hypothetical protein
VQIGASSYCRKDVQEVRRLRLRSAISASRKIRCSPAEGDYQGRCQNCIRLGKECFLYLLEEQQTVDDAFQSESKSGNQPAPEPRRASQMSRPDTQNSAPPGPSELSLRLKSNDRAVYDLPPWLSKQSDMHRAPVGPMNDCPSTNPAKRKVSLEEEAYSRPELASGRPFERHQQYGSFPSLPILPSNSGIIFLSLTQLAYLYPRTPSSKHLRTIGGTGSKSAL